MFQSKQNQILDLLILPKWTQSNFEPEKKKKSKELLDQSKDPAWGGSSLCWHFSPELFGKFLNFKLFIQILIWGLHFIGPLCTRQHISGKFELKKTKNMWIEDWIMYFMYCFCHSYVLHNLIFILQFGMCPNLLYH